MVLAAIAECCGRQLRSYDLVARYAGDEFVALTCGCQPEEIDLPIRRLQRAATELNLELNGQPIPVSLSIGAAVLSTAPGELRPDALFDAADHCLYLAKERGPRLRISHGNVRRWHDDRAGLRRAGSETFVRLNVPTAVSL